MKKTITILHSNDIHADFNGKHTEASETGGMPRLLQYINDTRGENPNTLYLFAGDLFNGDIMDKVYKGISTVECMNLLRPDVAIPGNHEVDFGLDHLLALDRFRNYPMICSNIYMPDFKTWIFPRYKILQVAGLSILVIGVTTDDILYRAKKDFMLGQYCEYMDPAQAVGDVCESFPGQSFDLTIVLSHLGFEKDKELAGKLQKEWGVDIIIGGHTHKQMTEPSFVNGIPIVQLNKGTSTVGRFDIAYDTETKQWEQKWECVNLDETHPENEDMKELIAHYAELTQEKYGTIIARLSTAATHPNRYQETMAGNLLCDALKEKTKVDVVFLGSGSLRATSLGPKISAAELIKMYFYDESLFKLVLTGKELKSAVETFLRNAPVDDKGHGEYYQLSKGCRFVYDHSAKEGEGGLTTAQLDGEDIDDAKMYTVAIEGIHVDNMKEFFGLESDEILARNPKEKLTTDVRGKLKNYFKSFGSEDKDDTGVIPVMEEPEGRTVRK